MLTEAIAASAATSGAILRHLNVTACPGDGGDRVRRALCRNPGLPDDVARDLLLHHGPDVAGTLAAHVPAARLVELLGRTRAVAPLRAALQHASDPDDILTRHACEVSGSAAVRSLALTRATTPAGVRHAAVSLASCRSTTSRQVEQLRAMLVTHPDLLEELVEVAGPDLAWELTSFAERRTCATARVGSPTWMQVPGRGVEEVVAAAVEGGERVWVDAVQYVSDPTGQLARAAIDHCPGNGQVLSGVVANLRLPLAVREQAALLLTGTGSTVAEVPASHVARLASRGTADFANRFAQVASAPYDLVRLAERVDLSPDAVAHMAVTIDRMLTARIADNRIAMHQRPAWGAWLATHPASDPQVRRTGLAWAQDWSHPSINPVLRGARTASAAALFTAYAAAAQTCQQLATQPAARVGGDLVMAHLRIRQGPRALSGPRAIVMAFVDARLGDLAHCADPRAVVTAVASLQETFPGTVGQLWDTAVSIAT